MHSNRNRKTGDYLVLNKEYLMNFKENYIYSPTDIVSGGVNSLHILCKGLIDNNIDAKMFYIDPPSEFLDHPVIKAFNVPYITHIEDSRQNILVVPEAYTSLLHEYRFVTKMVYWLGIYFYFKKPPYRFPLSIKLIRKIFAGSSYFGTSKNQFHALSQKVNFWGKKNDPIWHKEIIHMSNSYYAAEFIKLMNNEDVNVLHNPVRNEFYQQKISPVREKKILFGTKTPNSIIRKVRKEFIDFECIKLKRIPSAEIKKLYSESMLFIELGHFPGRNRMPREAVVSGCVIITSLTGSASYSNDMQLPGYYKLNTNSDYMAELIIKIKAITGDYAVHYSHMQTYIDSLIRERNNFNAEVATIFKQIKPKALTMADSSFTWKLEDQGQPPKLQKAGNFCTAVPSLH